jgi:hypothetical protein
LARRVFTNKTVQTLAVAAITAVITTFSTVATGWLNYPLDKRKAELTAELQKQLSEHDKAIDEKLERTKSQLTLDYTGPRLIREGVTAQQLKEDQRIRELIAHIAGDFVTAVATESFKPFAGKSDSSELWQLLQTCHLPPEATNGTREFHDSVQTFMQRYSDKDIPRSASQEAATALSTAQAFQLEAIRDLNTWFAGRTNAPQSP